MIDFQKIHIIPDRNEIEPYLALCKEYGMHFEYNDFFLPSDLDRPGFVEETIAFYKALPTLPKNNTMHGAFFDINLASADGKIREISEKRICQSMEIADKIGADAVILHTNFIPNFKGESYEKGWVSDHAAFIRKMLKSFPHVSIYMENMFDMSYDLLLRLAKELLGDGETGGLLDKEEAGRFGICLDYAHANVFGKEKPLEEWVQKLAPYVKHIHINNNDGREDSHMALSEGSMDYKTFFKLYETYLSRATLLLEVRGMDKIQKSMEYMKEVLYGEN